MNPEKIQRQQGVSGLTHPVDNRKYLWTKRLKHQTLSMKPSDATNHFRHTHTEDSLFLSIHSVLFLRTICSKFSKTLKILKPSFSSQWPRLGCKRISGPQTLLTTVPSFMDQTTFHENITDEIRICHTMPKVKNIKDRWWL